MMFKLLALIEVQVYLFLGQSNMVGREPRNCVCNTQSIANVFYYSRQSNGWQTVVTPPTDSYSFGPELSFMELRGTNAAVVKIASNSTSLATHWLNPGTMFVLATNRLTAALAALPALGYTGVLTGIAWNQGETDAGNSTDANAYLGTFTNMVKSLRTIYGTNAALVIARTASTNGGAFVEIVRTAQTNAATVLVNASWFDTDDLNESSLWDLWLNHQSPNSGHFSAEGQIIQGQRFNQYLP